MKKVRYIGSALLGAALLLVALPGMLVLVSLIILATVSAWIERKIQPKYGKALTAILIVMAGSSALVAGQPGDFWNVGILMIAALLISRFVKGLLDDILGNMIMTFH